MQFVKNKIYHLTKGKLKIYICDVGQLLYILVDSGGSLGARNIRKYEKGTPIYNAKMLFFNLIPIEEYIIIPINDLLNHPNSNFRSWAKEQIQGGQCFQ